jgi:hypothetical protein
MKKIKQLFPWVLGAILFLWLINSDLTTGTKTAIFVGVILYFIVSEQNKRIGLLEKLTPQEGIFKTPSYKLDIYIEPWWFKLYKIASGGKSEEELSKEIKAKEKTQEDMDTSLFGRRYYFTEYYDSSTGLTTRFQRVFLPSGKQIFYPVDEFGDRGYFFDIDGGIKLPAEESDKKREQRKKLSVEIGDSFIRNDIFDKHIGGPRSDFDYEDENYLFQFPLHDIFNFLLELGQRFHDTENNTIIKWPDHIEKKFKELGIKYETYFDYEPEPFDIEKHDKEFFEKLGKPKISLYPSDRNSGYLTSEKDGTSFGVSLKIFRPGENDRISIKNS